MRRPAPDDRPVALTIAGSDSGGGAGIQADLATMAAHDVYATSVVTAVTAQHTRGVESTHVLPAAEVRAQLEAVEADFAVGAAKTGMLATVEIVETLAERVGSFDVPLVVDPVMVAASGDRLLEPAAERAYEDLVAESTLVTPNADEAEVLTGVAVRDPATAREAGEALVDAGADAALVTGGHVPGETVTDVLVTGEGLAHEDGLVCEDGFENGNGLENEDGISTDGAVATGDGVATFEHPRVDADATHGSGCALSAAVAARLAAGDDLYEAVDVATDALARAIRYHYDVGEGPGAVNHGVARRNEAARTATADRVREVVDALVDADASALLPEVGTNVVGATPYAETVEEVAAVDGRIARTLSGARRRGAVRFGASSHVARFLLAAREFHPDLRFAVNCRFDDDVDRALADLGWPVAEYDRGAEPDDVKETEGDTMGWAARQAVADREEPPVVVVDRGEVGKEAMTKLLARDAGTIRDRALDLCEAVR